MPENPDEYGAPPPAPEPEPTQPPPDTTWVSMDIIEKSDNRPGIEHRDQ